MDVRTTDEVTPEPEFTNFDPFQNNHTFFDGKPREVLTRVELDLACFAEKLVNLNILILHVGMREGDFEAFVLENEHELGENALKALEFDFLSGVLDIEVREVDNFMSTVQSEIDDIREFVSSYDGLGESLKGVEDRIHDCEESLKQSIDQVSEIKAQSAKFQRILLSCSGEEREEEGDEGAGFEENGDFVGINEKVKLQTAEQQRHFLTMLEKSLAREMDLEKKVNELKQLDEELKSKLYSSQQERSYMEKETLLVWKRLLEAENASEIFLGISRDTLGRLQNEENLNFECKDLKETNTKLNEELAILTDKGDENEKVILLEKQLKEYDMRLQHSLASVDATEEKQTLLYDTINDMENIIEDLKSRVSRAEIRAEGVEENCIKLSETNAELNEEINILRNRLKCMEGSLRKVEENKMESAKDIGIRTKLIANLVMQLATERERLHKQISSLTKENKVKSQQSVKDNGYNTATREKESKERSDLSTTTFEMEKTENNKCSGEGETKLEAVRNIDATQINYKYVIVAALVLALSALAGFLVNQGEV